MRGMTMRLTGIGVLVIAGFAVLAVAFNAGIERAETRVETQNMEALSDADREAFRMCQCTAAGGMWDFGTGDCIRPD